jgi:hypothetical protein
VPLNDAIADLEDALKELEDELQKVEQEIEQLKAQGVCIIPKEAWDDPTFQPTDDAITLEYLYYILEKLRSKRTTLPV